ncbi:hypothetical protein N3K66_009097 [Trichothecium roseum]|uniref:Uncharacterized protein n=1 Tax=Trichothecium roseum TaxID=47278 RepID=A0ACC0UPK5_9HYPO|nr:hypothetical protein N3K66_009097 [Trichothecium roseum]
MDPFSIDAELIASVDDMTEEELRDLAEIYKDSTINEEIKIYIYSCFQAYKKSSLKNLLDQATLRSQDWVIDISPSHPDHRRRSDIFNMLVAWGYQHELIVDENRHQIESRRLSTRSDDAPTSEGFDDLIQLLHNQAAQSRRKFQETGCVEYINEAIEIMEVIMSGEGNNITASILNNYAVMIGLRFERIGSINDLNRAVDVASEALDSTPQDHPDRAAYLNNLGNWLGTRFDRTGSINDLNRAVDVASEAVDSTPQDHPDRAVVLNNLGNWLGKRFDRIGSINNLNRAVDVASEALDSTPRDHPDRAAYLNNLGNWLGTRFDRTGSINDLNRAVDVASEAVDSTPQDYPDRAAYLNNLGYWLGKRFDRTGSINNLNRAVDMASEALDSTPQDHPDRAGRLNNLGSWLGTRFKRTGSINDLNRAVDMASEAVDSTPQDHPDRIAVLNNLGNWLGKRFDRTGSINDLNRAVDMASEAVDSTPQDHPDRAAYLNNLGSWLGTRFDRTGSINDLNRAVDVASEAVDSTPQDHPDRAAVLNNLGSWLGKRFDRTGSINDLNRAVDVASEAVDSTPQDHPDRAAYLNNLGNWLGKRFDRTGSAEDLEKRRLSYIAGWKCEASPPLVRTGAARLAADIFASKLDWQNSSQLLHSAILLLPTISPRALQLTDAQTLLADLFGLASSASATALNAGTSPEHALQLLELGRGIIAGLLMDLRWDIGDLKSEHPELAEKFISLRDELDSSTDREDSLPPINTMLSRELRVKRRREADREFTILIDTIRTKPNFSNFLQPPTSKELMSAANEGPVVIINTSSFRNDAFIVQRGSIQVIELPQLTEIGIYRAIDCLNNSNYPSLLEWLWQSLCRPCLDALGFTDPVPNDGTWPHVWWVPTGLLSHLPLHAAGIHGQGSETVLDRVMSSYTPSIRALLYGRRQRAQRAIRRFNEDIVLMVAMRETPGLSHGDLPFTNDEVKVLEKICPSLHLIPVIPKRCKKDIFIHIQKCKIFHFAGHGQLDQVDPSLSKLLLDDWKTDPLTVGDIRDSRLQEDPPFLAYLSACSTSANKSTRLSDESVHLVSAFQLAGFRHVVGTLWEVSDRHCVDVARIFYETLREEGLTDTAVSRGLHFATRALRDAKVNQGKEARDAILLDHGSQMQEVQMQAATDFFWVPYVHFGV